MLCFPPAIALGQGIEHLHDDYYSYKGLVVSLDMDNTHPLVIGNFLVMTDSALDYYSAIKQGIFIADTYDGGDLSRYEIQKITFDGESKAMTIISPEYKEVLYDIFSKNPFCVSGFWSNRLGRRCVYFKVFEIDFIFRKYKQVSFETANAHAKDGDEAMIEYTTTVYFITKVLSLKRVNVGRAEIPVPDSQSTFHLYKDDNRYREARAGCPPVKIMEDSVRNE